MIALARTVRDLLSRRTPVVPHLCLRCETYATSISASQHQDAMADGFVTCACGSEMRRVCDLKETP